MKENKKIIFPEGADIWRYIDRGVLNKDSFFYLRTIYILYYEKDNQNFRR